MSVKLIIFDLDGTLVDAYKAVSASLNHALGSFGFPLIDDHTIQRSVGWGERALVGKFVPPQKLDAVLSAYRIHHRSALKSGTRFLPGARKLLDDLGAQGYQLAIASNRPSRFTHIILKHLGVQRHFAAVVCADQVSSPKPAPDILLRILEEQRLSRQEALYVGDMTIDVETGLRAGVRTIAVMTGSSTKEELEASGAQGIVESVEGITGILNG